MAKQAIGIGTVADDGTGDPLRTAFDKTNDNFDEVYPVMASGGFSGNATATTIAVISTYVVVAGTVASSKLVEMTMDAAGRITYTGTITKHFHIVSNFDMTTASNNQIAAFQWFKNGVAISVPVERKVSTGADIGAASLHADASLATSDYLELKCTNLTSATNVTVKNLYLFTMGVVM